MDDRIPVILDTDIGGDIDDTWALAMILKCPELDVRLVVSDTGDTVYRSRIIARMLEVAGRTDVPVGVGLRQKSDGARERQAAWVADYDLARYPGTVHGDGVQALIDTIMRSNRPPKLVCIGPVPNVAAALQRTPEIAQRAHFVGMHGAFARHHRTNLCYGMAAGAIPEWNVKCDIPAAQAVFAAPWLSATITPADTCGMVVLDGDRYQRVRDCREPLAAAVIENYRMWSPRNAQSDPETHSSVLFDTVAVYLAFSTAHLAMKRLGVSVDDCGYTVEDAAARPFDVALDWTDLDAYRDLLTERLTAAVVPGP